MRIFSLLFCCFFVTAAHANWKLDNELSSLSFVSVKKAQIAEVHYFKELSGTVADDGKVTFEVALTSVDTNIEIRDQRMNEFLFKTGVYPKATFSTELPASLLAELKSGDSLVHEVSGTINLHGAQQAVTAQVLITKAGDNKMTVSTLKPFIINAADFNLVAGIMKLQEIAKLPSITQTVPVSFALTFTR